MIILWYAVIFCIVYSLQQEIDLQLRKSITIDENAKLVLFGMRHGNRYPGRFLDEKFQDWGFEGIYELTQFGKREGFGFGKELREFVGPLVSNNYMPNEVTFYTSSSNRCQMTLQVAMAGFYPPDTFAEWNHALEWSPVPYTIDDPMLRMFAVPNCNTSTQAWEPISNDQLPELMQMTTTNAQLLNYITEHTGWNSSIESASYLADNLLVMNLYNTSLPKWIEQPTWEQFKDKSLKESIMIFLEKHSVACVNYEPCRDIMGGVWLNHILSTLSDTVDGHQNKKLIGYVSHFEVTLSVMKLLKIKQNYLDTAAGFLLEYRDKPKKSIRLLYHETSAIDRHIIKQAEYLDELEAVSDPDHWIPFESFYQLVKDKAITNWEEACGQKQTRCVVPENDNEILLKRPFTERERERNSDNTLTDHHSNSLAPSNLSLCNVLLHFLITLLLL